MDAWVAWLFWIMAGLVATVIVVSLLSVLRSLWRLAWSAFERRQFVRALPALVLITAAAAARVAAPAAVDDPELLDTTVRWLGVALATGVVWLVATLLAIGADTLLARYDTAADDNLAARRYHTRYRVLAQFARLVVWGVGAAWILSTFPAVSALGGGILASAGVAGLVIGLAAQRTVGNFLAGIQIALTQPIRIDDAVVIEGEWGWIEEITTTYVVVKIWDERRLIVPFAKLLEEPFQNWTRNRAEILGSVTLWVDPRTSLPLLRRELARILDDTELWDGRVGVLQAVETSERALQIRALVSASSSPRAWDLRCLVREKLLGFVAREEPRWLPRTRAEIESASRVEAADAATPAAPVRTDWAEEPPTGGLPGEPEPSAPATDRDPAGDGVDATSDGGVREPDVAAAHR